MLNLSSVNVNFKGKEWEKMDLNKLGETGEHRIAEIRVKNGPYGDKENYHVLTRPYRIGDKIHLMGAAVTGDSLTPNKCTVERIVLSEESDFQVKTLDGKDDYEKRLYV